MADAIPQPPNTLGNITDLVSKLAPLFLGTGKTTTNTTASSTASPGAIAANQQLYNTATANANNPSATDATVQNILNKSAIDFAPTIGEQNGAGLYNSSTLAMLSAQAQGQAVAQSAQAVLNYQTSQEQIATSANNAALNATKTTSTTGTAQTAPAVDPTLSILGAAGSLGLNALKTFFPDTTKSIEGAATGAIKSGFNSIKNLFGSSDSAGVAGASNDAGIGIGTDATGGVGQVADAENAINAASLPQGSFQVASAGISDVGGGLFDTSALAGDDEAIASAGLLGDAGAATASDIASFGGTAADFGADAATSGADLITSEGEDAAAAAGEIGGDLADSAAGLAGGISAIGGVIHLAGSLIGGDAGTGVEAVGDLLSPSNGIADVGAAIGDAIGGTAGDVIDVATDPIGSLFGSISVICTVLKDNGSLDKKLWIIGSRDFIEYSQEAKDSYYTFAIPIARYIKKYPKSVLARIMKSIFSARNSYIAALKKEKYKKTLYGFFAAYFITLICSSIHIFKFYRLPTKKDFFAGAR